MRSLFVFAALFFSLSLAQAGDLKINVQEVKVYKEMDPGSEVITTLFKGDGVKVSNKNPPGFQKVLVQVNGTQQVGYIRNGDLMIKGAAPQAGKPAMQGAKSMAPARRFIRTLRSRFSMGLYGGINYRSEGTRTNTNTDGSTSTVNTLNGMSTRFGLSAQFAFNPRLSGQGFVEMKSVSVSGTGTNSVTGVSDMFLKETFYTVGFMGQYYLSNPFWIGVGGAYDYNSGGTFKNGTAAEAPLDDASKVSFIYLFAATGYDFALSNKMYLTTDLRLGALLSRPLILEGDVSLKISYLF